ncbi:MAG: hypothetical protein ACJ8GO_04840 [Ramlibacter sp.]
MARWAWATCMAGALVACGGGGGSSGGSATPSAADTRNGAYTMMAADGREYSLTLNFDAKSYQVTGNAIDQSGAFQANGAAFEFLPANAVGATGTSTTRFSYAADTVVGEFAVATGAVPFIASRTFATSLPTTTMTFNMLGRTFDTAAGTADTTIQQGQITSDGRILTCDDIGIFEVANCPAGSTTTGTLTISGSVITAATSSGNVLYRIATVGSDKVLLRASQSLGTTRRFVVGLPASSTFAGGTFVGGTTEPAWGSATLGTTFSTTGTSPAGVTTTRSGTAAPVGTGNSLANLLAISTSNAGSYFATASAQLGVVVSARGNAAAPGFMAIGVRQ